MIRRLHWFWRKISRRGKTVLSVLAVYISMTGLVTFSLFILEEGIQTAMFGTWPAQDAKDWETVRFCLERIKNANGALKLINYSLGWIQPLAFVAYKCYGESADAYIAGLEAKLFANAPELFAGRKVTVSFTPQSVAETPEGFVHVNHRVSFLSTGKRIPGTSCRITGFVSLIPENRVLIKDTPGSSKFLH
jgi:hypothetical protein